VTDLNNTYGTGWASRTDLVWSVAGITTNNGTNTFDATSSTGTPTGGSTSFLATPAGDISSLSSELNPQTTGLQANGVTLISTHAADIGTTASPASGISGSDVYEVLNTGNGGGGGSFGLSSLNTETGPVGSDELYSFVGSTRSTTGIADIGTFSLNNSGALTFDGIAAVPEPSTYAMLIAGLGALFVVRRMRRNSTVA
jgi:hypothetical protein